MSKPRVRYNWKLKTFLPADNQSRYAWWDANRLCNDLWNRQLKQKLKLS